MRSRRQDLKVRVPSQQKESAMSDTETWAMIHAERGELADFLSTLTEEQWATRSLCSAWTVRELVGHLLAAAQTTPAKFMGGLIGSGFRFNAWTVKHARRFS